MLKYSVVLGDFAKQRSTISPHSFPEVSETAITLLQVPV